MIDSFFYPDNSLSLSLSPPVFSNSIAIIFFFPQINWNNFFSFHFGNNIATNQLLQFFFLQFSATSLPKLLLNFCHNSFSFLIFFLPFSATWLPQFLFSLSSPLQFQQLGCHNLFLLFFFLPFSATWLPQFLFSLFSPLQFWQLGCHNWFLFSFSFFFPSYFQQLGCHNSYFPSSHSPRILATWLPQFLFSLSSLP